MDLLIVDDEPSARAGLIKLCERAPDLNVIGEASTGARAIEVAADARPDLLLLDAELPDMSGFEVLRALGRPHQQRTILVTDRAKDVTMAMAAGVIDCLLKPVHESAFSETMRRAREHIRARSLGYRSAGMPVARYPEREQSARPLFLVGEREHRLYPLDPQHIDYIESAGNYVRYCLGDIDYIARESIKRLQCLLLPLGFVRIERSILLNIRAIAYAQSMGHGAFSFTLISGKCLQSGHAYRDEILQAIPLRRRAPICEIEGSRASQTTLE